MPFPGCTTSMSVCLLVWKLSCFHPFPPHLLVWCYFLTTFFSHRLNTPQRSRPCLIYLYLLVVQHHAWHIVDVVHGQQCTTMTPYIYGGLSFLHKLFWLLSSVVPPLQAVSSQPTAVSSLVCSPNPTFQHPSPSVPGDKRLRLRCAGLQHRPCT